MKVYYAIGAALGVFFMIVVGIITSIGGCVDRNKEKKRLEGYNDVCYVRYFTDETEDSRVVMEMLHSGDFFHLSNPPKKEGYIFAGLYDNRNYQNANMYVDSQGNGIIAITRDIILYPIFVLED